MKPKMLTNAEFAALSREEQKKEIDKLLDYCGLTLGEAIAGYKKRKLQIPNTLH